MICEVPANTPVTTPVFNPIVATVVVTLVQVPPGDVSLNVVVKPTQTAVLPVIGAGSGLTVKLEEIEQPVGNVYVTVARPVSKPVAQPEALMITSVLLHTPPADASVRQVTPPQAHTFKVPEIGAGRGLTVTDNVA